MTAPTRRQSGVAARARRGSGEVAAPARGPGLTQSWGACGCPPASNRGQGVRAPCAGRSRGALPAQQWITISPPVDALPAGASTRGVPSPRARRPGCGGRSRADCVPGLAAGATPHVARDVGWRARSGCGSKAVECPLRCSGGGVRRGAWDGMRGVPAGRRLLSLGEVRSAKAEQGRVHGGSAWRADGFSDF